MLCFFLEWSRNKEINSTNSNRTRAMQRGERRHVTQGYNDFNVKYDFVYKNDYSNIQTRLFSGQQLLKIMDTEWESSLLLIWDHLILIHRLLKTGLRSASKREEHAYYGLPRHKFKLK